MGGKKARRGAPSGAVPSALPLHAVRSPHGAQRNAGRPFMRHQPRISLRSIRATASGRRASYSPCQTAQFLRSRLVLRPGSLPSFSPSSRPTPAFTEASAGKPQPRGLAERREASQPCTCRAVTRDATVARRGPSRATGRPASRRSAVALSALHRLRARGLACGRADAKAPRPPGIAARLRCRAFRIRGYHPRATSHPAPPSGSLLENAPHERDFRHIAAAQYVVIYNCIMHSITFCIILSATSRPGPRG
jgi:hypothetical protein